MNTARKKQWRMVAALVGTLTLASGALVCIDQTRARAGEPSEQLAETWHEGLRVEDRHGKLLREMGSEANLRGRPIPLSDMGERIIAATLVSEDKHFFEHDGVNGLAIARAIGQNVREGRLVSGASTITQQLVKLLDAEGKPAKRTLWKKILEAARAQNLELVADKQTILEAYLNRLDYGHGLSGPEAAAQGYFGVSAKDLSFAQAAYLAVLPRAPSYLDPYEHNDRVLLRQRALIDALHETGVLNDADFARATSETVHVQHLQRPFYAPHFVNAVVAEMVEPGEKGHGVAHTTLDLSLQQDVEGLVKTHLASLTEFGATNAAVVVVDNATGDVLSWTGSSSFWDETISGQVDMVRAKRQPGSTLKPFVYAMAFADGHNAAEPVADVPTYFSQTGGTYAPGNFDGTFEGPISAREALAGSLNVPAVRLASEIGENRLLDAFHQLGFASLDQSASHYGLAMALGAGEVTLRELATAYVTLARGGESIPLRLTLSEREHSAAAARFMDRSIAALITETLSDPLARVRGLHGRGPFDLGFPVAVKTGTSSGYRDTWCVGYTHERTVAVWLGNTGGAPTQKLTGATGAGPLFADVMRRSMNDVSSRAPLWDSAELEAVEVCPLSGKRPGPACADHASRHFIRGKAPTDSCDMHVRAFARPIDDGAKIPYICDPAGNKSIVVLPEAYDGFLASLPPGAPGHDTHGLPWFSKSSVPGCGTMAAEALRIDGVSDGSVFVYDGANRENQVMAISASLTGGRPDHPSVREVEFVVDGEVIGRSRAPFRATYHLEPGDHELTVRPADAHTPVQSTHKRFSVR
ncbi:MAG TPA: penicillin-binding protein 1C [Polyangium sp.]|nr:penicillin-binding protein 1C [Polyangium sp.]